MLFNLSSGAAGAMALVIGIQLYRKKIFKRLVPWLMLIAGLGLTGASGKLLGLIAGWLTKVSSTASHAFFGTGLPWLITVVMLIHLMVHMNPLKRGKGPERSTPWVALFFPAVLAVSSGVLAGLAGWVDDSTFQQLGVIGSQFLSDLTSGAGGR